ncbi:Two-component system yycFG regulatory protein [Bhargavaea cecembensis DSE10]|uniref:Two-component system yycFG regulatory protein n=1 Tax=Bhargavaea cecembensis DSE10 TaxID=1235279 RepID=M7NE40_9BACL|nr:two-component system regulatory protein YycI [Bhargavaea cecembensis]EMR05537.1 Two-component system yycFG regulatory protein [Bhargavaea cecembensis DSE10]
MDWSKTKTIFIVVFAILNVFLFSLYMNRTNEDLEVRGETSIEDRLKLDDITYGNLPDTKEAFRISGELMPVSSTGLRELEGQTPRITGEHTLISEIEEPFGLEDSEGKLDFEEFLEEYVTNGKDYTLWEVDEEKRTATFFQQFDGRTIFYNEHSMLTVHWNEEREAIRYEQSMLFNLKETNEKRNLYSPIQTISLLVRSGSVQPGSNVKEVKLGYSPLIQLTQTQVLVPTWHIHVESEDGAKTDHFVNAVDGKILDKLSEPDTEEEQ